MTLALFAATCTSTAVNGPPEAESAAQPAPPMTGFVAVSGSADAGCGVRASGHLQCWGSAATPPAGKFTDVGVGRRSCGLRSDGTVACWGAQPQRSDAAGDPPWPPPGEFAALSSGEPMCALRIDGSLACAVSTWGEDDEPTPGGAFVSVSVGDDFACGIRPSLSVECWGSDFAPVTSGGDVIYGHVDTGKTRPPEGAFTAVAAAFFHACALDTAGAVVCWGDNRGGQLVGIPEGRFAAVTAGLVTTRGLRVDGAVVCWGGAARGAEDVVPVGRFVAISERMCGVSLGGNIDCWRSDDRSWKPCLWLVLSHSPFEPHFCRIGHLAFGHTDAGLRALPPVGEFVALSARKGYTCGLLVGGESRCWGLFFAGEAEPPPGPFTEVSAGWFHACGLRPNGAAACWGNDTTWTQQTPTGPFTHLSAGWGYTCGLRPDGALACWGREPGCADPALNGPTGSVPWYGEECWDRQDSPAAAPPAGTYRAVAAGAGHACALTAADGTAVCWGDSRYGQSDAPAGQFTSLSAGFAHTCALRPDGTAACWGTDNIGQSTPPPTVFTEIVAGEWHTCGLRPDGNAECWGNHRGTIELWQKPGIRGDEFITPWAVGLTVAWSDARPAPPPGPYTTLAAGNFHTCAIRTDRSVDCWGHSS